MIWLVMVCATCFASDTSKSRRTSLWILPSALVLDFTSAPLVSVCPKISRAADFSHQSAICKNGLLVAVVPLAALCSSISIPSGMMPAALWPISATARSRVFFFLLGCARAVFADTDGHAVKLQKLGKIMHGVMLKHIQPCQRPK